MSPIFESNFSIRTILSNREDSKELPSPNQIDIRPNYTYSALVTMAIRSSPEQKLTLSSIQQWIMDNFPYYRKDQRGWQCQIRHTLTTNSCFMKIPRPPSDPGRGNYWTVNPEVESIKKSASPGQAQVVTNAFESKYNVNQAMAQGVPHPQMPTARYFPTPQEIELLQQQLVTLQQQQYQQQCEEIYRKITFHQQQCAFLSATHYPMSEPNS
ncbi:forkhead box protein I1-like [Zeugodacus cucurbitae]|uniref:forkhead box protein I1-like n=1 Tax=Zeugodacus cucurbitae TaxID=28588 RepID=UPI0023D8FB56|nr:forkhead box protein I1-like [Zeugodacus cucurbitae]